MLVSTEKRRGTRQNKEIQVMKKILFSLIALVSVCVAQGQIMPVRKVGAVETIATARAKNVQLNRLENNYY